MTRSVCVAVVAAFVTMGCAPQTTDPASPIAAASASGAAPRHGLGEFPEPPAREIADATASAMRDVVDAAVDRGLPGVSATVVSAGAGMWTGVAGSADGVNPIQPRSQFAIASLTKTIIAAEVLHLVEAGHLRLSDSVSDHLPAGFEFDTNGATVENLLAMESGIPDPTITLGEAGADPNRVWTAEEVLRTVPPRRSEPGDHWVYEDSNYMLLGLVIKQVTGTDVAAALRDGVLADPRLGGLVYQPDERPDGPLALPFALPRDDVDSGGGYLPSAALASWGNGSGCMASDSATLALFGYLLFGGSLLSDESLRAMTDFGTGADYEGHGLGVLDQTALGEGFSVQAMGNGGWEEGGYSSILVVLPSEGVVVSVMTNTAGSPVQLVLPIAQELASIAMGLGDT